MRTLAQLCIPRESVYNKSRRDVVLDLTDLIEDKINPGEFFNENYRTDGMRSLFREAFRRFEGKEASGIIRLTQAMGGGKTHNLIALGLLAKNPQYRSKVIGDMSIQYDNRPVRVVAFTGRESDAPLGIWGTIAEQLGKKEQFNEYYSPLSAPGQTAWIRLLRGEPLLILLDELPPYFENAKSKTIGDSNLANITTTALANLLVAVGKEELSNVCVVISDLRGSYEGGSQYIDRALENLESEIGRSALDLEPVGLNTDEVYHILRKRLFETLPEDEEIKDVAQAYAQAVREAQQMDFTSANPNKLAQSISDSYPFHPAIKDLYARFRENPGFQQTRGLIKLMRVVVSNLYSGSPPTAEKIYLIHPHHINLNDRETLALITSINPSLENAISHDIASNGQSAAEQIDEPNHTTLAQDITKLIFVSSLANIPNALVGLSIPEIATFLAAPNYDLKTFKDTIGNIATNAWYLHTTRDGKLFFKNVKNLVAQIKSISSSYNRESSIKELRKFLSQLFQPSLNDCYQVVQVFPALDEIVITADKVTLVVCEPHSGGLNPDLKNFYQDLDYKNRILFLTGERDTMDHLLDVTREYKAISFILEQMEAEKIADNDPQKIAARDLFDKIRLRLLSAIRETFTTLIYPHSDELFNADFLMNFTANEYRGEHQIRDTLQSKQKFTEDISSDTFRKKCEERLFTQKTMAWNEVKKRAAMKTIWQWHHPNALDSLKKDLVYKNIWKESGGYVEKGPFPPPAPTVQIQELRRDDNSGEVILRLTPVHCDTIYYDIGDKVTINSLPVENYQSFTTRELIVSFLGVDSKNQDEDIGEPVIWKNRITIQSRQYQSGEDKMVEIRAIPTGSIYYSTDGSNPMPNGARYAAPFPVPPGTVCVLAVAEKDGILSDQHRLDINWDDKPVTIDPSRPVIWKRLHYFKTTQESYEFINRLKKFSSLVPGPRIIISYTSDQWLELIYGNNISLNGQKIEETIETLRQFLPEGQVSVEAQSIFFERGQLFYDWIADVKTEFKDDEVVQE